MQLGFVSAILPELDFQQILATAKNMGYDCVEIMCWPPGRAERRYAGVTHIDVTQLDEAAIDKTRELCAQYGVDISGLGYYPNPLAVDSDEAQVAVEHLRNVISAAPRLGIQQVNTFVGRNPALSVDENWPGFLDTWKPLVQLAETNGVRIGIENCPMSFTRDEWPGGKNLAVSPAIWDRMFNDIPSEALGLNYDPSHMIWQQMDYLRPIHDYAEKLFHVHAKDVRMDIDKLNNVGILAFPSEYHTPKLPGMGDVDWGKFFSALTDTGYQGPVCVEVEDRAFESSLPLRRLSLKQSYTYLRNFVPREEDFHG